MHFWKGSICSEIGCIAGHYVSDYDGTGPKN